MTAKTCEFCKRDTGLKVFVNRYIFSSTKKNLSIEDAKNQKKLYSLDDSKSTLDYYLSKNNQSSQNSTIDFDNNTTDSENDDFDQLETIKVTASEDSAYSYPLNNTKTSHDQYGFQGSTLRQGFLYVYLKHINKWEEYQISELGFLKRINENNYDEGASLIPLVSAEQKQEPCMNIKHRANALTITIPKPNEATTVYFKYSEKAWSKQTKARNKASSFYEKYMDKFDVKKFIAGQYQKGAFPMENGIINFCTDFKTNLFVDKAKLNLSQLKNVLVENNLSKKIYSYSDFFSYLSGSEVKEILNQKSNEDSAQSKSEAVAYTLNADTMQSFLADYSHDELKDALSSDSKTRVLFGAIFTINDPVGVVMDISAQIAHQIVSNDTYNDEENTVNTIQTLKNNFGINDYPYFTNDELAEKERAKQTASKYGAGYGVAIGEMFEERRNAGKTDEELFAEEIREKKVIQDGRNNIWNTKYIHTIDRVRFDRGLTTLKEKQKQQVAIADVLDQIGLEFISGTILSDHFFFNHEKDSIADGVSLGMCTNYILESTKLCPKMNKYMGQYLYNTKDPNNYFLNFISLNSSEIRQKTNEKIDKLLLNNLNDAVATQPFADMINSYIFFLGKVKSEEIKFTLRLNIAKASLHVQGLAPPNNLSAHPIQPMMISMYSLSEVKSERIYFNNLSDFNTKMRNYYTSHQNITGKNDGLGNAIKNSEWKYLYKQNISLGYIDVPRLEIAPEIEKNLPKNFRNAVKTHAELLKNKGLMNVPTISTDVVDANASSNHIQTILMKTALVGLQSWAISTVFKQSFDNQYEKTGRRSAAVIGLTMSCVEAVGELLNVSDKITSQSRYLKSINSFILKLTTDDKNVLAGKIWRGFGLFAGLIFGGFDVYNGIKAGVNGEVGFGAFLTASGLMVIIGSGLIFLLNPFGWIVLIVGIILSLIAYWIKENDIQLWIRRSLLSFDNSIKRFENIEQQVEGLKLVYK